MRLTSPDHESAIVKEYGTTADGYADYDLEKWKNPSGTAKTLQQVCAEFRPERVLDLGAGTGRYFPFISGNAYVGVDVSKEMIAHARLREGLLRERGFTTVNLVTEEIGSFLSEAAQAHRTYDLVFSIGCIGYHLPVTPALISSIGRILTPNGILFLQTTQLAWKSKLLRFARHWRNTLAGRADDYPFHFSTSPRSLRRSAVQGGLEVVWIREDSRIWRGRPLLLSLYRKI